MLIFFQYLEESYSDFYNKGCVYVTGDFNARCGNLEDFILNDVLEESLANNIQFLVNYDTTHANETGRSSMDKGINNFGKKLINLCQTTGLRIANGRKENDCNGNITFFNANGTSTIDYLLTDMNTLDTVFNFQTGKFNIFSDHAPLTFVINQFPKYKCRVY